MSRISAAFPKETLVLGFSFILVLAFSSLVHAHRVNIFAWVEGGMVHTESKFSNGKPVKGGEVSVFNLQGESLISGKTDEGGFFSFPVPAKAGLKVVLDATMGHRAEWIIAANEIAPVSSSPGAEKAVVPAPPAVTDETPAPFSITAPELEKVIDAILERRLQPIQSALTDRRDSPPNLRDVIGGLGYILGLMGVAAYFRHRGRP